MKRLFIISGEKSGDLIAQDLIPEIRKSHPHIQIRGVGGDSFVQNAIHSLFEQKELTIMGFIEIIPKIPRMIKLMRLVTNEIYKFKPTHIITIDSPGFNFQIAKSVQNTRLTKGEIYQIFNRDTPEQSAKSTTALIRNIQKAWHWVKEHILSFISRYPILNFVFKYLSLLLRYLNNRYTRLALKFLIMPLHILIKYTPLKIVLIAVLGKFLAIIAILYAILLYINTFRFFKWPIIIIDKVYNKVLSRKEAKKDLSRFHRTLIIAQLQYKNTIICNIINIVQTIDNSLPRLLKFKFLKSILNRLNLIYKRFKKAEYAKAFNCKIHHIVAPSVWAYKPKRAQKVAMLYDTMFCILPFECPYFEKYGLKSIFIGYTPYFRMQSVISHLTKSPNTKIVISITLGSREGEVKHHAPIIYKAIQNLNKQFPEKIQFNIITLPDLEKAITPYFHTFENVKIIKCKTEQWQVIYNSDFMIAKSGTNVMECALLGTPSIVYYKTGIITTIIVEFLIYIKYITLLNITAQREILPELIKGDVYNIHKKAAIWIKNPSALQEVRHAMQIELQKFISAEQPSMIINREISKKH